MNPNNANIPAGLRNASDLLYFECTNKPFLIVSYGRMGEICFRENLKQSLNLATKARVVESGVSLVFGPAENRIVLRAVTGQDLGLSATEDGIL